MARIQICECHCGYVFALASVDDLMPAMPQVPRRYRSPRLKYKHLQDSLAVMRRDLFDDPRSWFARKIQSVYYIKQAKEVKRLKALTRWCKVRDRRSWKFYFVNLRTGKVKLASLDFRCRQPHTMCVCGRCRLPGQYRTPSGRRMLTASHIFRQRNLHRPVPRPRCPFKKPPSEFSPFSA